MKLDSKQRTRIKNELLGIKSRHCDSYKFIYIKKRTYRTRAYPTLNKDCIVPNSIDIEISDNWWYYGGRYYVFDISVLESIDSFVENFEYIMMIRQVCKSIYKKAISFFGIYNAWGYQIVVNLHEAEMSRKEYYSEDEYFKNYIHDDLTKGIFTYDYMNPYFGIPILERIQKLDQNPIKIDDVLLQNKCIKYVQSFYKVNLFYYNQKI